MSEERTPYNAGEITKDNPEGLPMGKSGLYTAWIPTLTEAMQGRSVDPAILRTAAVDFMGYAKNLEDLLADRHNEAEEEDWSDTSDGKHDKDILDPIEHSLNGLLAVSNQLMKEMESDKWPSAATMIALAQGFALVGIANRLAEIDQSLTIFLSMMDSVIAEGTDANGHPHNSIRIDRGA